MPNLGRRDDFGITKEATRLTAETTAAKWFPYTKFDLQLKNEFMMDESAFGRRENFLDSKLAQQSAEGSWEGILDADTIGDPLFYLFGSVNSVTASGATTHTFSVLNSGQIPTFSAFYETAAVGWLRGRGTTVSELEISVETGTDAGKYSAKLLALAEAAPSSQTPSYTKPTRTLIARHVTLKYATNVAGLSSPTTLDVKSVKISMKNNPEFNWDLGSVTPTDVYAKSFEAEISFSAVSKTSAFDTLFRAGTSQAFQIDIEDVAAAVLGSSLLKPKLTFKTGPSPITLTYSKSINDITTFDATIKCEYSITDSFAIQAILQNVTASY